MRRLFLNGLAASAGGGLTYLRNVVPHLSAISDVQTTVLLTQDLRQEFGELPNVDFLEADHQTSAARRFWQEQTIAKGISIERIKSFFISEVVFVVFR